MSRHADESLLLRCKRCGSLYTWDGKPCPGCGAAEWVPPPAELAESMQAVVERRRAGTIDAETANRQLDGIYHLHLLSLR